MQQAMLPCKKWDFFGGLIFLYLMNSKITPLQELQKYHIIDRIL